MVSLNRVIIAGNIIREPEMKVSASNQKSTVLTVAINDSWTRKNGERQTKTTRIDVITYGNLAENCAKYLSKGFPIMAEGRIGIEDYVDADGVKHSNTKVVANSITFLENKSRK